MNYKHALFLLLNGYFFFCISLPSSAQKDSVIKECFSASRHELAENLCLYSNHRFEYASSYGAVDLYGKGSWEKIGARLKLTADSSGALFEVLASNDASIKKDFVQLVFNFNAKAAAYIKLDALANLSRDPKEIGQLKKINNQFVWLLHKDSLNPVISLTNSLMEGVPFFYLLPANKNRIVFSPGKHPDLLGFKSLTLELDEKRHYLIDGSKAFRSEGALLNGKRSFIFESALTAETAESEGTVIEADNKTKLLVYHDMPTARQKAKNGNGFICWIHGKPAQSDLTSYNGKQSGATMNELESYISNNAFDAVDGLTFLVDTSQLQTDSLESKAFFKLVDTSGKLYLQTIGFLPAPGKLFEELQFFVREKSVSAAFATVNLFLQGDTSLGTINKIISLKNEAASYNSTEALDSISYVKLLNRMAEGGAGKFDPWRYELILNKYEDWDRLYVINESNVFNSAFWKYLRKYYFEFENYKLQSHQDYALAPVYKLFKLLNKVTSQFGFKEYDQAILKQGIDSNMAWIPRFNGIRLHELWKGQLNNLLDLMSFSGAAANNQPQQSENYVASNKASLYYLNQVLGLGNGTAKLKNELNRMVAEFKSLNTKVNWKEDMGLQDVDTENCEAFFTNSLQNSAIMAIVLYTNQGRDSSKGRESIGWLNTLRTIKDENSSLAISLAFLQYQVGNRKEAIAYLGERLKYFIKQPDNKYYLRVMGSVLRKMELNLPIN